MVVGTRNVFSSPYSYFLEKKILVDMSISLSIYLVKVTTVNIHMTAYLLARVANHLKSSVRCSMFIASAMLGG